MDSSVNKPKKDQAVLQLLRPLSKYLDAPEVTEVTINRPAEVWTKTFKGWEAYQVDELNASSAPPMAAMPADSAMQDRRAQLRRTPNDSAAGADVRINSSASA